MRFFPHPPGRGKRSRQPEQIVPITERDWERIERLAYGPLALRPWEFARLRPREFWAMHAGWRWRERWLKEHLAYLLGYLVNVHLETKNKIRPQQFRLELLGRELLADDEDEDEEDDDGR